jgi:hypothetical protein
MSNDEFPTDKTSGDYIQSGLKALCGGVPFAGGALAELVSAFKGPLEKRREEWFNLVSMRLKSLEETVEGFILAERANDPHLLTALIQASGAASRTDEDMKIEALLKAVESTARGVDIDETYRCQIIRDIDAMTGWHLSILSFLHTPIIYFHGLGWGFRRPCQIIDLDSFSTLDQALTHVHPELGGRREFYEYIVRDLHNRGLIKVNTLGRTFEDDDVRESYTTEYGKAFFKFIGESAPSSSNDGNSRS